MLDRIRKFLRQWRLERHRKFLIKNRILMPKPRADERNWSGAYMESLK